MSHDTFKTLMMGYIDGELTELERERMERHLEACPECRAEAEAFTRLKEITRPMKLAMPEEAYWEQYWSSVYNRLERRAGWILLSIGAVLLVSYGCYLLATRLLLGSEAPLLLRTGLAALLLGFFILLASVIRERIYLRRSDKYRRIKR